MKSAVALLVATAGLAVAQPHRHGHMHAHEKRDVQLVARDTVVVWELNGRPISATDVREGIQNGTLKYDGAGNPFYALPPKPSSSSSAPPAPASPSPPPPPSLVPEIKSSVEEPKKASPTPVAEPKKASPTPVASASYSQSASGVDADFPDGELACSDFPDQYGALSVDWMSLGGWTSIQNPGQVGPAGFDDILTVTKAQCNGDTCCTEGSYCSYACPPNYLKFQWPSMQGATGQSVGGLLCKNGKLHLTNPDSKQLCRKGTDKVRVKIQNKLGGNVALCRTEYPGSENMVIPLDIKSGDVLPVACPDAEKFYHWQGGKTSAQYYLNREGYSVDKACQWGKPGDDFGNYAPMVLGVGYTGGAAWLSIQSNMPTQSATQNYAVEIKGDHDTCKFKDGQYCNSSGCNDKGCTVSVKSGEATYVVSNS